MATRTSSSSGNRERGVKREAEELENTGWSVTAAVEGWDDPDPMAGHVPDILARKQGKTRIVRIETDLGDTSPGHEEFLRRARAHDAVYYLVYVDENGRRIQYRTPDQ